MGQADKPLVGIVMGSDSDFPTMKGCFETLKEFSVPCEVRVLSAHRGPGAVADYAGSAPQRGLRVLIAVLSVAELMGEAIRRIHRNESVSALFGNDNN